MLKAMGSLPSQFDGKPFDDDGPCQRDTSATVAGGVRSTKRVGSSKSRC